MKSYHNVRFLLKLLLKGVAVLYGLFFISATVLADISLNDDGVALYGYDPVSFFDGAPAIGKSSIYFDNNGARMGKKLDVELLSTGLEYEIVNGQLYLLLNRATHEMWKSNRLENISISDKIWPAL